MDVLMELGVSTEEDEGRIDRIYKHENE